MFAPLQQTTDTSNLCAAAGVLSTVTVRPACWGLNAGARLRCGVRRGPWRCPLGDGPRRVAIPPGRVQLLGDEGPRPHPAAPVSVRVCCQHAEAEGNPPLPSACGLSRCAAQVPAAVHVCGDRGAARPAAATVGLYTVLVVGYQAPDRPPSVGACRVDGGCGRSACRRAASGYVRASGGRAGDAVMLTSCARGGRVGRRGVWGDETVDWRHERSRP